MTHAILSTWNLQGTKLRNFVFRHTKDRALTDDILQDVFLKVHDKMHQVKDTDKLVSWIFQITRNSITDHFRRQAKAIHLNEIDWPSNDTSHRLNDCAEQCVKETLGTLPEKYREALQLADLESTSQLDLAEKLKISYSGAKSRVQRARQMLKEKMQQEYLIEMDKYGNVITCRNKVPCGCS